jgi:hypothetical protein
MTVSVADASKHMTILATVKTERGITDTANDALISTPIQQASAARVAYSHRKFASKAMVSLFRADACQSRTIEALMLERVPVTAISAVMEDGVTLTARRLRVRGAYWVPLAARRGKQQQSQSRSRGTSRRDAWRIRRTLSRVADAVGAGERSRCIS